MAPRVASANIDLALTLLNGERLDEACDAAQRAILRAELCHPIIGVLSKWSRPSKFDNCRKHRTSAMPIRH